MGKRIYNGHFKDEETAARARDTLARKLIENGEKGHKLNFPNDETEVHAKTNSSKYVGVSYAKRESKWQAKRWNKNENRSIHNGYYDSEEAAAYASDTVARKIMENGSILLKLNFPDEIEQNKKRKRSEDSENLQNN